MRENGPPWTLRLAARLPPSVVRIASRGLLRSARLRALSARYFSQARSRPQVIMGGLAQGMIMDVSGAPAGFLLGVHERGSQTAMAAHLREGSLYYDLGANVGAFVLMAANLVGPTGRIVAVEPVPANIALLRRNVSLNSLGNVSIVERAVSDRNGTLRMLLGESDQTPALDPAGEIEVEVISIDDHVDGGGSPPDFVKIDVEGEELRVLEGMRRTIEKYHPVILCETHTRASRSDDPVAIALESVDYTVSWLEKTSDGGSKLFPHLLGMPTSQEATGASAPRLESRATGSARLTREAAQLQGDE